MISKLSRRQRSFSFENQQVVHVKLFSLKSKVYVLSHDPFRISIINTMAAARISSRGRPKFFEQHSPGVLVKPSESNRNGDIEEVSPLQEMRSVRGF